MSIFNLIVNALDNPQQQASVGQLTNIIKTVETLSSNSNISVTALESAMSILGKHTKTALQEKQKQEGENSVQQLINQFAGTQSNNQIVNLLFSQPQIQNILTEIHQKTAIEPKTIQSMMPMLLPLVLNLLKTGQFNSLTKNSVLTGFLDTNGDGEIDIADALSLAHRYLKR